MVDSVQLGSFEISSEIGRGGMGIVFGARHERTGLAAALKVIRGSIDEDAREKFHREVRSHAGLVHPNVVYLFDYGEVSQEAAEVLEDVRPGSPYVAMQRADGGTARDLVPADGWPTVRSVVSQVLDALAFSHARGVLHQDLKPANLLLFDDEPGPPQVRLTDFGVAHRIGEESQTDVSELTQVAGTPHFMAPEQARADWRNYGPWTDLYSLGCIVWTMVCGEPPYGADQALQLMWKHLEEEPPPLSPEFPVPEGLESWLRTTMATSPTERYRRAATAVAALENLSSPSGTEAERSAANSEQFAGPTLRVGRDDEPTAVHAEEPRRSSSHRDDAETYEATAASAVLGVDADEVRYGVADEWRPADRGPRSADLVGTGLGLFGLRETPFVDRDDARERLWESLRTTSRTDAPHLACVVGSSGAGKSRLVQWVARRAHELAAADLVWAYHTAGGRARDEGLPGMVRRQLRAQKLSGDELEAHVDATLPDPPESIDRSTDVRALTELLDPSDGDSDERRRHRFSNLREKTALVARFIDVYLPESPTLLWLDDIQWGSLARAFVSDLMEGRLAEFPVAVICTVRDDIEASGPEVRNWLDTVGAADRSRRIDLEPLGPADHRTFVERTLPLENDLARRIAERTEGNPLFARQWLGHLVERGRLVEGRDGFRVADDVELELPADVDDLWRRRIEALVERSGLDRSEPLWRTLERAAVLGREVDADEWEAICGDHPDVAPNHVRDLLLDAGLADATDTGWAFTHGLLVETLVHRADAGGRLAGHHRACAELLERLYPERPAETAARRAEHRIEAGELEAALEPLGQEAARLKQVGELDALRDVLERRLDVLGALDRPEDDPVRLATEIELARCGIDQGKDPRELRRDARRARERADERGRDELVADARRVEGRCSKILDDIERAARELDAALERARDADDRHLLWRCYLERADVSYYEGNLDETESYYDSAMALAEREGHPYYRAVSKRHLGWIPLMRGELDRAENLFQEALGTARRRGYRLLELQCLNALGEISRRRGPTDRTEEIFERIRRLGQRINQPQLQPLGSINLAQVLLERKKFDDVPKHLERADRGFRRLGWRDDREEQFSSIRLARAAGIRDWEGFEREWERFCDAASETERVVADNARLLEFAGDFAREGGEVDRAERAWRVARDMWQRMGREPDADRVAEKLDD